MRAVVMHEPGNVTVEEMPMPSILEHTDAIIKLAATCICGSDLWPYRGEINPGAVFDLVLPLEQAAEGYAAMDERRAAKVMLTL